MRTGAYGRVAVEREDESLRQHVADLRARRDRDWLMGFTVAMCLSLAATLVGLYLLLGG